MLSSARRMASSSVRELVTGPDWSFPAHCRQRTRTAQRHRQEQRPIAIDLSFHKQTTQVQTDTMEQTDAACNHATLTEESPRGLFRKRRKVRAAAAPCAGRIARASGSSGGEDEILTRRVGGAAWPVVRQGRPARRRAASKGISGACLRLRRLVEAEFDRRAAVIVALLFVVGRGLLGFRMLATGEKLEARQDLQSAMGTRRHPEGRNRNCEDGSPGSHLTQ